MSTKTSKKYFTWLLREQPAENLDIDYVKNEPNRKKIPHNSIGLIRNKGRNNIRKVYEQASEEEKEYWGNWYHYANGHVQELADKYEVPLLLLSAPVSYYPCSFLPLYYYSVKPSFPHLHEDKL